MKPHRNDGIDPAARSLTEWLLEAGNYVTRGVHIAPARFESALFPELAIELERVFPPAG